MARVKKRFCQYCGAELPKEAVGLGRKLLASEAKRGRFTCLPCMAAMLEVSEEDLRGKIEAFKAQGCRLFG